MSKSTSTLVPDGKQPARYGHDTRGKFAKGNKLGRGNPLAGRAAKIRAALLKASTPDDVKTIAQRLIDGAKSGDLAFIREWPAKWLRAEAMAGRLPHLNADGQLLFNPEVVEAALTERASGERREEGTVENDR
jgi:hypothetical protein